ncbi:MAG: PEP-CTERM sorting domain-containing protein [Isosphaeraceae bacterium]
MRRGIQRSWLLAGLAVFGTMVVVEGEARAKGIVVTSGSTQSVGDPFYEYTFAITLQAGTTLDNGGYITIYDLPGLFNDSATNQPGTPEDPGIKWGSAVMLLGLTPSDATPTDSPSIYNVTWEWNGSAITAPAGSDLNLGTFTVTTDLSSTPTPTPTLLNYLGSVDGSTESNSGTVTVSTVPEPSATILLLLGAGALPLYAYRNRRRSS